jgi:hypothetical protein
VKVESLPKGTGGTLAMSALRLIQDQVEAGAHAIPTPLERREARVAAADFEGESWR